MKTLFVLIALLINPVDKSVTRVETMETFRNPQTCQEVLQEAVKWASQKNEPVGFTCVAVEPGVEA